MKKILLVLWVSVLTLQNFNAQNSKAVWEKKLDEGNLCYPGINDMAKTRSRGVALIGDCSLRLGILSKIFFLNPNGELIKENFLDTDINGGIRIANKIIPNSDGYVIFGIDEKKFSDKSKNKLDNLWMMKTDCNGGVIETKIIWSKKSFDKDNSRYGTIKILSVITISDGYLLTAKIYDKNNQFVEVVYKLDKNGQVLWEVNFDEKLSFENLEVLKETVHNEYCIIGYIKESCRSSNKNFYVKLDKEGKILTQLEIVELGDFKMNPITNKKNKLLFSVKNEENKFMVVELNEDGKVISKIIYDMVMENDSTWMETDDDCYLIGGNEFVKINKKGEILWKEKVNNNYSYNNLFNLGNNEFIAFNNFNILKLKDQQPFLGIDDVTEKRENVFLYPNPVESYLYINVPKGEKIKKILVTDISGKKVFEHNTYQDKLDVSMCLPGVYFLKIETEYKVYVQKMLKK